MTYLNRAAKRGEVKEYFPFGEEEKKTGDVNHRVLIAH